jgi:hypothetical protein
VTTTPFVARIRITGLKNNALRLLPSEIGKLSNLKAIFLTDNKLEFFPSSIGQCTALKKIQAGRNKLQGLPSEIGLLQNLELLRLPLNELQGLPPDIVKCRRLAWLALAGNPFVKRATPPVLLPMLVADMLHLSSDGKNLASAEYGGAANDGVLTGLYMDEPIAIKYFQPGPDGDPMDEIRVGATLHEGFKTDEAPRSLADQIGMFTEPRLSAVFSLVKGSIPLAKKPLDTVRMLRGRWENKAVSVSILKNTSISDSVDFLYIFQRAFFYSVLTDVVDALSYMHLVHISHGDIYAHNVLVSDDFDSNIKDRDEFALVFDYGASFYYPSNESSDTSWFFEACEVRAFGLLLIDVATFLHYDSQALSTSEKLVMQREMSYTRKLGEACADRAPIDRPLFADVANALVRLRDIGIASANDVYPL